MPVLTPYAAQEMAMVSRTPGGSGLPIGLMPGALPSDQASRQTLNTTAMRLPFGHSHFEFFIALTLPRYGLFEARSRMKHNVAPWLPPACELIRVAFSAHHAKSCGHCYRCRGHRPRS